MLHLHKTAILIFSRTARKEAAIKQYSRNARCNISIAANLIGHTERVARRTGIPVIKKYSGAQKGENFGLRLANAIEAAFAQGYSKIISIGTDTPGITTAIIQEIAEQLQEAGLVTGPSADGGVYAIGISSEAWNREAFLKIAWQTGAVLGDLRQYASGASIIHKDHAELADIDDQFSFAEWFDKSGWHHHLVRLIGSLINTGRQLILLQVVRLRKGDGLLATRRGPPVFA